mgnify:FL=1
MSVEQKRSELAVMAEELGGLPLPIETIIALEETGAVVDLATGAVLPGRAEHRYRPTVVGEAAAVAAKRWERG